ncbi:hypothetical protein AOLI_G00054220 [Acnodon oligacanthus]
MPPKATKEPGPSQPPTRPALQNTASGCVSTDAKCDDLEVRSRHQYIKIVGVPEGETFSRTNSAVSELLRQAFDMDKAPEVDCAYRSLAPKRGDIPCPIAASLHYYSDCAEVLKRARQKQ